MARYLLAASPLPGHVMPLLHIGADLRRRGHQVWLLTGAEYRDRIRGAGMDAVALPPAACVKPPANPMGDTLLEGPALMRRWRSGQANLRSVFIAPLAAQFHALRAQLRRQPVDAILVDIAFTGVLPLLLHARRRTPVLVCGVGPLTLSSMDTPPFGMAWQPDARSRYRAMTWVAQRLLLGGTQFRLNRTLRSLSSTPSPVFVTDWPVLADTLLQLTVPAFEYPRCDLPTTVVFTGPVIPDHPGPYRLPHWWQEVCAARTVIHVTQGTWDNADIEQLIGPTLRTMADRDVLVVATTGRPTATSPATRVGAKVYITDYLPYSQLLPHVDVMITNGGYGGVHHALRHGVPLIVAGDTADKPEVAARVSYTGVGIDLGTGRPTPAAIRAAVQQVLSRPHYHAAAQRLSRDIAASQPLDTIADTLRCVTADRLSP